MHFADAVQDAILSAVLALALLVATWLVQYRPAGLQSLGRQKVKLALPQEFRAGLVELSDASPQESSGSRSLSSSNRRGSSTSRSSCLPVAELMARSLGQACLRLCAGSGSAPGRQEASHVPASRLGEAAAATPCAAFEDRPDDLDAAQPQRPWEAEVRQSQLPGLECVRHVSGVGMQPPSSWPEELRDGARQLRAALEGEVHFQRHAALGACKDSDLVRFLLARRGDVIAAEATLRQALQWRSFRMPYWLLSDAESDVAKAFEEQSQMGKVTVRGRDRFGRGILACDTSVEHLRYGVEQIRFVAYNFEAALDACSPGVDKICFLVNLEQSSIRDAIPMSAIRETIQIFQTVYPETLGHCILWQPPASFMALYRTMCACVDARTLAKVIVVKGGYEPGSKNDSTMCEIFGSNWRELTGLGLPRTEQRHSEHYGRRILGARGYVHEEAWKKILARDAERGARRIALGQYTALAEQGALCKETWDKAHAGFWAAHLRLADEHGRTA